MKFLIKKNSRKLLGLSVLVAVLLAVLLLQIGQRNTIQTESGVRMVVNGQDDVQVLPCAGNRSEQCIGAPTRDIFPSGSETAQNEALRDLESDVWKSIGGQVTSVDESQMVVTTDNNVPYTFKFGFSIKDWWNAKVRSSNLNAILEVGDTVRVDYNEAPDRHEKSFDIKQIRKMVALAKERPVTPTTEQP